MKKTSKTVLSLIIVFLILFLSTPIDAFSNIYSNEKYCEGDNYIYIIKVKENGALSYNDKDDPVKDVKIGFYRQGETVPLTKITDESGTIVLDKSDLEDLNGYCTIIEAPFKYLVDRNEEIKLNFNQSEELEISLDFKPVLEIDKRDFETNEPVEGAKIGFYKAGEESPFLTGITDRDGKIDKTTATGEVERINPNGTIILEVGKYYFKEINAPKDYILNEEKHPFEAKKNKIVKDTLTNEKEKPEEGKLDFTKKDEKGNALAGAKIAISKSRDSSPIIIGTTGSDGRINKSSAEKGTDYIDNEGIITLEYGDYELSEIEAPQGYEKSNEVIKIEILDGNIIETSLKNILKNEEKDSESKPEPKPEPSKSEPKPEPELKPEPEPKPEPSKSVEPTKIVNKDKEYIKSDIKFYKNIKDKLNMQYHYAYMFGYPDETFRPERPMTRAEVAAMFARLMKYQPAENKEYPSSYNDIDGKDWYFKAVEFMTEHGIVTGYPDGSFKPNGYITRAEFATMASRFDNLAQNQGAKFPDVPESHWASKYINSAVVKGWVHGYPDGTFKPKRDISRAEVVTLTNHMLNRQADKEFVDSNEDKLIYFADLLDKNYWAYYDIREAADGHEYHRRGTGIDETWEVLNHKEFRFAVVGRYKNK